MKTIAIANQKGGVGKSTTAAAMVSGLARAGHRTLAIDLDAQRNLSMTANADTTGKSTLGVLLREYPAAEAIQKTESMDIIAANKALSGADAYIDATGKEFRLREALEPLRDAYDYVILDTPPALGILTINALTAADSVIIPAQADYYSLQGIEQLAETIHPVRQYCNPSLTIDGILLTRFSPRSVLSREVAEMMQQLAQRLGTKVFTATIREAIGIKEAQISQQSLFAYTPKARVTEDYRAFIQEILEG